MRERRNAYTVLEGKPGGKRPLGRHMRRWEDFLRIGWVGLDWTDVSEGRGGTVGGLLWTT